MHDEELQIFGGQTRIVSGRASATPSSGNNSAQSPSSTNSPEGAFSRTSPKTGGHRGFTPETLDKAHPSLLADLRTTKETEPPPPAHPHPRRMYHPMPVTYGDPQSTYPQSLPQEKYQQQMAPPNTNTQTHPSQQVNTWNGTSQTPTPAYAIPMMPPATSGYVPAPSDTQVAFGMLGGDPDWENHWQSFMNQIVYPPDPNAPYTTKMER